MSDEPEQPPVREALCFLPVKRGQDYAEAVVPGGFLRYDLREALMDLSLRMEACRRLEVKPYLDKDHDFRSQLFIIEKAYLVEGEGVFVVGSWTQTGLELRSRFQGVSQSCVDFNKYPPPVKYLEVKRREWKEMEKTMTSDPDFFGALGCVCIDIQPTFVETSKRVLLDGASDDTMQLMMAFNSAKISWPLMPPPLTTPEQP